MAVHFCGKLPGQRERRFQVRFDDGTTFDSPLSKSEFGRGFFGNLFLRPACHTCPYASVDRPGDLSLGAFYGLPKDAYPQEQGSRKQGAKPGKRSEKPSLFTAIKERLWKKH